MKVYAFSHQESVVRESSSGGAFTAIAEMFFLHMPQTQKVVYGVTFDEQMQVVYRPAYTLEQCASFRGSKYVRSRMQGVAEDIARHLQDGYAVLFVGTPCFVYALKTKLEQIEVDTTHLICVDLICHGTPEPKFWDAYKQWLEKRYKSRLTAYRFRSHIPGKPPYTAVAQFQSGKQLIGTPETALFNRMFLRHYTMAEGCFRCRFANLNRQGDLTIGDFWGIETVMPQFPKGKGVSEILVHTPQGERITQWMLNNTDWDMQLCTTMDFVQYQNNLRQPADKPQQYQQFRGDFQRKGFGYVATKYVQYDLRHRIAAKLSALRSR